MKKTLLIFAAFAFALTACDKSTYVDGDYTVTYDQEDSHGWTAFLEFTLLEDAISDVDFDYTATDDGRLKSTDTAYASRMLSFGGTTTPDEFIPALEAQIANATIVPDYVAIDGFTGATGSSGDADILLEAGLEAALEGTTTVTVVQPDPPVEEQ